MAFCDKLMGIIGLYILLYSGFLLERSYATSCLAQQDKMRSSGAKQEFLLFASLYSISYCIFVDKTWSILYIIIQVLT